MKEVVLLIVTFLTFDDTMAQPVSKKIPVIEGTQSNIEYKDLNISTLLQLYDEKSEPHLVGDMYLRVDDNGSSIAEFYVDHDEPSKEYYTHIYKNYFLTFQIENQSIYLLIEPAQLGKAFALASGAASTIQDGNTEIELKIIDYVHEWGTNSPPEVNGTSYDDVQYTLKIKIGNLDKDYSFYSSEVDKQVKLDLGNYEIIILSDRYKTSQALLEIVMDKKSK